jgi:hypothetical protein
MHLISSSIRHALPSLLSTYHFQLSSLYIEKEKNVDESEEIVEE